MGSYIVCNLNTLKLYCLSYKYNYDIEKYSIVIYSNN